MVLASFHYGNDLIFFNLSSEDGTDTSIPKLNISMQIEAGAETVMIFDSSAHQLDDKDFSSYLEKVIKNILGYSSREEIIHRD